MSERTLVPTAQCIDIPSDVQVCPICGSALSVQATEWTQRKDGTWKVTSTGMEIECETEPDIDSDDWEDWHRGHYSMPYVDWLPIEPVILAWLNRNYDWRVDPE